jgi:hypothetical protein
LASYGKNLQAGNEPRTGLPVVAGSKQEHARPIEMQRNQAQLSITLDMPSPVRDSKGQVYLRLLGSQPPRRKQQALFEARSAKDFSS